MNLKESIKKIPIFENSSDEELEFLQQISTVVNYPRNATLYYEAENVSSLQFLIEGQIKVYKVDKYDNEIFLYYVNENSMISELSSLESDTIYCFSNTEFLENSKILMIDYPQFKQKFLSSNTVVSKFVNELIVKNQQLQCIINRELVFDATAKVAYMLSNSLDMFNKLKRTQAAFMLHIQPETLSRVLKRMVRNEIIEVNKGEVKIINEDSLKSIFLGVG
jgi:CRP/FNR family transcriptional regulator